MDDLREHVIKLNNTNKWESALVNILLKIKYKFGVIEKENASWSF